ncbi:MAG: right-handed parallel beta-helix repeat-containing protein, partial [bacterium]
MRNGTSRDCRFWTMVATGILSLMLRQVPTAQAAVATGGNITTNYAANGTNYCAHIFTTPGTTNLTFTTGGNVEVLLVAGGGGGGSGGGGAGGFLTTFTNITTTGPITVTVGMGGLHGSAAITGKNGSNSVFGALTAIGGGGGTLHDTATGKDGGSGGGAGGASGALTYTGGFGTAGQGNNGGSIVNKTTPYGAAGGGGAGALGSNVVTTGVSGKGGNGTNSSISGNSVTYAGGGGGGTYNAGGTDGAGGLGGGGAGGVGGTNGTANTGGGGGGTRNGYLAGDGGSGIVIVRYPRELIVEALPASGVSTNSAMLNGILALNGGINADVYFCWGYTNAGTNSLTDWAHYSLQATNWGSAAFSTKLTGLLSGSGYVYRCFASNSAATAWSGTQGFTTVYRPAVINLGSIDAVDGNTLQGQITDTGFDTTYAWFYWWPVGGSTSSVAMGSQTGTFSAALYQLVPSQNYQYQVLASNLAGPVWSMVSNFTCLSKAWYAATNGNNGGGTNWTTAYSTLSNALNYVQNNDTLYVAGQTFNLTTQVNLIAKRGGSILGGYQAASDAVLPGPNDPAAWPTVWRRASGTTNRILYLDGLTNCLLRGLTLREGATSSSGAGVYLTQCRGVTMDRCTIVTNVVTGAGQSGGGIYAVSSVLTLTNCLIATNSATGLYNSYGLGGGVCLASGMLTVEACHVTRNAAWGNNLGAPYPHGGGIWLGAGTTSTIVRTVVDRNVATALGGGIYSQGKMDLVNSLVIHNDSTSTDDGDGICLANANGRATILNCTIADNGNGVGILYAQGTVCMTNSIVWGHSDDLKGFPTDGQIIPTVSNVAYCCIQGGDNNGVQGCFSIDPLFADTNYFHLRSKQGYYGNGYFSGGAWTTATSNSPLIDMGDPAFAFVQEPAPNRGRINLGAYGNTEVASMVGEICSRRLERVPGVFLE